MGYHPYWFSFVTNFLCIEINIHFHILKMCVIWATCLFHKVIVNHLFWRLFVIPGFNFIRIFIYRTATQQRNDEIIFSLDWFSKDNATANRTVRAQENNRLGLGRELGRVARKSDLAKNNRTCGMWKHMFSKFVCSLVLWGISRLFFALLKSDWEHKHAWLMNLVRWLNHLARWMECSILNLILISLARNFVEWAHDHRWNVWSEALRLVSYMYL